MATQIAHTEVEVAEATLYKWSVEQYELMIEAGILQEDDRVELIEGEIIEMAAIHLPHAVCVARLSKFFERNVGDVSVIWAQNPIRLERSRPEPDVVLLKWRNDLYAGGMPTPQDVLLLVEVSARTLAYDRKVKAPLYARAGIGEYWIANLVGSVVEVYSEPVEGVYQSVRSVAHGESLPLPAGLDVSISVESILGPAA